MFQAFDKDNDGKLSKLELKNGYAASGQKISDEQINDMFDLVDLDHSGFIDYSEWIVAAISDTALTSTDKLQLAFKMFDKDGSGLISANEITNVLKIDDEHTEEIEYLLSNVDTNGDGEISFEEFCLMMKKL